MKSYILCCALLAAVSARTRLSLDEEELKHAKQFREEALAVERALSTQQNGHYVEPAPLHEGRHLGLGLGFQVGPVGFGVSSGIGKHGVGFNTNAGYGQDYLSYGSPEHYSQYYSSPSYRYLPQLPHLQSRTLGLNGALNVGPVAASAGFDTGSLSNLGLGAGTGFNVGPVGLGASAGIGQGNIGLSAGLGWGGQYSNYGSPQHYQQYYANPYSGPYFHPAQLV